MDRDCDNCARFSRDGCTSWDCDYINRKEAIEAWEEKHRAEQMPEYAERKDAYNKMTDCSWK